MAERRVLVLTTTFPARPGDATPPFVYDLSRALATDHDITVVAPRVRAWDPSTSFAPLRVERFAYAPRRFEGLADGASLPNLHAEPWRAVELPLLVAAFLRAAQRAATRVRPDLIHAHWILPSGVVAAIVARRLGIPYVLTGHGVDVYAWPRQPLTALRSATVRRSAGVGVGTEHMRGIVAGRLGGAGKTEVLPMGVDVDGIRAAVGRREPVAGRVLFLGRLADKKGVSVLLQSLPRAPGAHAVVAGDGPLRAALEAEAAGLGLGGRVTFAGAVERHAVTGLLREAALMVIPSLPAADGDTEGTSMVLSEAAAAGVGVVASRVGGLAERITDGVDGILVDPGDPAALGRALAWAVDHPEAMAAYADRAATTLTRGASTADAADGYRRLYQRALAGPPRPSRG